MVHVKKKRTISIKNPKLKRVRNSLREVISQAHFLESKRLGEEASKIINKFTEDQDTDEMIRYRNETREFAFWRGAFTENFQKWLEERDLDLGIVEANYQKKLELFETDSINKELEEKEVELSGRRSRLDTAWKNSICVCPVCGSRTSDMTFNPYLKAWFCVDCYEKNRDFYIRRGEPHIYP